MIAGELKNRVDSIWNTLWAGGLSNPIGAVSQITYLIFIKLLDDEQIKKESTANIFGDEVVDPVFDSEHQNCRWSIFKHFSPEQQFINMQQSVFPFIKEGLNKNSQSTFARYMKEAMFQIPSPKVLNQCILEIDSINFGDKDILGDMYEYLLQKMASQSKAGQFRTPSHIVRLMVELAKPTLEDRVCDPAMGTAGFLKGVAAYIYEHFGDSELLKEENVRYFSTEMFTGFDTDNVMIQIGAMNMMLHKVEDPHIERMDSISDENTHRGEFSLIMANPPFAGGILDLGSVAKDLVTTSASSKKTELLFLALFTKMLRIGGRCLSIVPEGVLNNTGKSHDAIRRELVEKQRLEAVIYMPSGVFKPYAGVKTAILVFTKTDHGGTDKVWLYNMEADGYSLDDKRAKINDDDIPDIVHRFNHLDEEQSRTPYDKSFFVTKEEIAAQGYALTWNKYHKAVVEKKEYRPSSEILSSIEESETEFQALLRQISEALK